MAKKYKFKLEGLLKLREFAEEKAKIELGKVNMRLQENQDAIDGHHNDIKVAYESQEEVLKTNTSGSFLQFYPRYFQAQQEHIKDLEKKRAVLMKEVEARMQDLMKARADMKVMEKLREKDFTDWKKAYEKEMNAKIEENTQMWLAGSKSQEEGEV